MLVMAALVLGQAPWSHRLLVAAAWLMPLPAGIVVGFLRIREMRSRQDPPMGREAAQLLEVVAALQAGQPLRSALTCLSPTVSRLVAVGADTDRLAQAVGEALGEHGDEASAAVRLLDHAGGPAVGVFSQLAAQATETVRIRREVRAAVAAPVLQGVVIGGAPLTTLVYLLASGEFGRTFSASPAHAVSVSVGAAMTVVGVIWVGIIVRKALP